GQAAPIEALRVERVAKALEVGPQGLDLNTRLALLSDPVALSRLHEQVWAGHNTAWIDVWRASIANDPHSPLLPLHPENVVQPALA
ncbi:glucan biosynthesis glucosyltransferase H, partial [Pseudomonas soli]